MPDSFPRREFCWAPALSLGGRRLPSCCTPG